MREAMFPSTRVQLPPCKSEAVLRKGYGWAAASLLHVSYISKPWCDPSRPFLCSLAVPSGRPHCRVLKSTVRGALLPPSQYGDSQSGEACKSRLGVSPETLVSGSPGQPLFYPSHRPTGSARQVRPERERPSGCRVAVLSAAAHPSF